MALVQNDKRVSETTALPCTAPIRLSEMPADESRTILKTIPMANAIPTLSLGGNIENASPKSVRDPLDIATNQVAAGANIAPEIDPIQTLEKAEANLNTGIAEARKQGNRGRENYLIQMSRLVGEISSLLNQWNIRDNHRSEEKKRKYNNLSTSLQENYYSRAGWKLASGLVSGLVAGVLGKEAVNLIHPFLGAAETAVEAQATKPSNELQVILTELQKLNDTSSSNNNLRDQALQLLGEIKQWAQKAISHG